MNPPGRLVIDTNIALDVLVFEDEHARALREALEAGQVRWLATAGMRDELRRVLDYPLIARRRAARGLDAESVMARFDAWVDIRADAAKAAFTCKDPDDQKFIDLAVAEGVPVLSKDHAVLCMDRRLGRVGSAAMRAWPGPSTGTPARLAPRTR
jgi:predicted nucleic acid-binding protein